MKRLIGIYREREYSPGRHQSNDALLLEQVADRLRERDLTVDLIGLDQLAARPRGAALVFSMCQGRAGLDRLVRWERAGERIVNNPRAALNTYRDRLPQVMARAGVPFPQTDLVPTSGPSDRRRPGFWLKRGDVHASVPTDVQWIASAEALDAARAEFASRGVASAAVQAHQPGDEIKFYGIGRRTSGTGARPDFFHWFYTGAPQRFAFDHAALTRLASRAAEAAGLDVFGGDVIVSAAGELTLIDLNDWPSFAPCRDAAAEAIADYLTRRVHVAWNPGVVSSANESAV